MSSLEYSITLIVALTSTLIHAAGIYSQLLNYARGRQQSILARTYRQPLAFLITYLLPTVAEQYEKIDAIILRGSGGDALTFRQSVTDECNMTAVAGAIIAQVAITALSLPSLSLTHWVARAAFLIAVASGCLSVYYSCHLQRIISKLYTSTLVRGWLTVRTRIPHSSDTNESQQSASLAAVLILSAPFAMVKVSIFSFLIGLAIYQGFVFTKDLDPDAASGDSRDNFIALMIVTGLCMVFFLLTYSAKDMESIRRSKTEDGEYPHDTLARGPPASRNPPLDIELQETDFQLRPTQTQTNQREEASNLASLLEAAAQAHARCADADRQVALAYTRMSQTQDTEISSVVGS